MNNAKGIVYGLAALVVFLWLAYLAPPRLSNPLTMFVMLGLFIIACALDAIFIYGLYRLYMMISSSARIKRSQPQ